MKKSTDFTVKPYNRCLSCHHRKVSCDGPRTAGLELMRWKEYMRDMKEVNGITNAYIAEVSMLSEKTIERALSMSNTQDIMRDTARLIENAIIGSTSKYPCYLAFEEEHRPDERMNDAMRELERVLDDNKDYKSALDNIHTSYKAEMDVIRSEAQRKIDFLLEQIAKLRTDNDHLWEENIRKSKMIDTFIEKQLAGGKVES